MKSDASLKGKIKALAKQSGLKPQELLQMHLFEYLLIRLERSDYAETFVLKGGLLISSMTGISQRTTMDMDATVVGMDMDEATASKAVSTICSTAADDGMEYSFERIEPIREGDEYANWRAHLRVRYGKIDAPVKIDTRHAGDLGRIRLRVAIRSRNRLRRGGRFRVAPREALRPWRAELNNARAPSLQERSDRIACG